MHYALPRTDCGQDSSRAPGSATTIGMTSKVRVNKLTCSSNVPSAKMDTESVSTIFRVASKSLYNKRKHDPFFKSPLYDDDHGAFCMCDFQPKTICSETHLLQSCGNANERTHPHTLAWMSKIGNHMLKLVQEFSAPVHNFNVRYP
jgi:hypothetical protein